MRGASFLTPFILLRNAEICPRRRDLLPFYSEAGSPRITLVSAYAVLYALPVLVPYLLVNWRFGFRFFGGIKR